MKVFWGGEVAGRIHVLSKAAEVADIVTGKENWSDERDGERGRGY